MTWQSGEITSARLEYLENEDLPRVQYLSQQFVEHLCSAEGLEDELLSEIERVIFQAHPIEDRMGAASFRDLLDIRLARARNARQHSQEALSQASEALTVERARKAGMDALIKRRQDKYDVIEKDKKDRQLLTSKGAHDRVRQLDQVTAAVDEARNRVEELKRRHGALLSLQDEVKHIRNTFAPAKLKELRETHAEAGLTNAQWSNFKLVFAGDVDSILDQLIKDTVTDIDKASGPAKDEVKPDPKAPPATSSYIPKGTDFTSSTLTLLEKEMNRLQRLVGIDAANAKKLTKLSEKIAKDQGALAKLDEELKLARRADERIKELIEDRKRAYGGVFSAITEEQKELVELYAPLSKNLRSQGGEIGKLAFSVRRSVDIDAWARKGEDLLDLRKIGPFKGKGTLKAIAEEELRWPWEGGTVIDVAEAMGSFRDKHERSIIEHAPFERSDREHFAAWARSISDWLYDTSHITVSYGLQYGGVDIEQLSPGTRGIVLLLL